MNLRILIIGACPYPVPQGSQVFMRDHALALKELGHEVQLLVYGYGVGEDESGLVLHRVPSIPGAKRVKAGPTCLKLFMDLGLLFKLRQVFYKERIDVAIAHNYEALLAALLAGVRPLIYHAHNAMLDELPYYFHGWGLFQKMGQWLDQSLPRRADHCIVPHTRLAEYLLSQGVHEDRITLVPQPVLGCAFVAPRYDVSQTDVLYTGNLDRYQNLGLLYEAMDKVHASIPGIRLLIATHQTDLHLPQKPYVEVKHVDHFADMRRFLEMDVIFALPRVSWSGYPVKLLNAMTAGRPVVACSGASHELTNDLNALVVPDNDASAFAEAILRLVNDIELRKRLGLAARDWVLHHHAPAQAAAAMQAVLERVVSSR